jgi:beta-glucosidase
MLPELAHELTGPLPPFPPGFLIGAATAAHQLDGGDGLSDWSRFEEEPGRIARGERSGKATGHRERVEEDVRLLSALGANAYRFSLEWARLEPEDGRVDGPEWERVRAELALLRAAGITPLVTLLHFTLPAWLAVRGGLLAPDFAERFGAFAGEAARRLGGEVQLWATLNEPNVQVVHGYIQGSWPPGRRSPREAGRAFAAALRAHAAAVRAVRAAVPRARVGPVVALVEFEPVSRWSPLDRVAARLAAATFDWSFLEAIRTGRIRFGFPGAGLGTIAAPELRGTADWIGVNYYTRNRMRFSPRLPTRVTRVPGPGARSDLDWEIHPPGLLALLREAWSRYRLPLFVTENGIADAADLHRPAFLRSHLHMVARALAEGIPVGGYFHWSLLDNFEWAEGFAPRFGLYAVDYATLARTPRPSVEVFRQIAAEIGGGR